MVTRSSSQTRNAATARTTTIALGTFELPSLGAYRLLFGLCAGAALLGAVIALVIPTADRTEDAVPATAGHAA